MPPDAPSSTAPAAKPISLNQLQAELSKPDANKEVFRTPDPASAAPSKPAADIGEPPKNFTLGDDKGNRDVEPSLNIRDAAKKKLEEKAKAQREEAKGQGDAAQKEEPAKKEEAPKKQDAAKKEEPAEDVDVPEDSRRVLPHDKPETAKRIKYFLSELKKRDEKTSALEAKLKELESKPQTAANDDAIKAAQERLAKLEEENTRFRRRYEIDTDPDFAAKYRKPAEEAEEGIKGVLKNYNFGDATFKVIQDEGGFAAFSRSRKVYPVKEPTAEDPNRVVYRTGMEIARGWLDGLSVADKAAVEALAGKQQLLRSEEQAAIKQAQDEAKAYYETQSKAQREAQAKAEEQQKKIKEEWEAFLAEAESGTEWLKEESVPADAPPERKKEIEDRNEFAKQLRAQIRKAPANPREYGEMVLAAAESHILRRTLGQKDAEIARLQEEVKKAKGAMRTTPKSGSLIQGGGASGKDTEPLSDPTDFKTALKRGLAKFNSGADE